MKGGNQMIFGGISYEELMAAIEAGKQNNPTLSPLPMVPVN